MWDFEKETGLAARLEHLWALPLALAKAKRSVAWLVRWWDYLLVPWLVEKKVPGWAERKADSRGILLVLQWGNLWVQKLVSWKANP